LATRTKAILILIGVKVVNEEHGLRADNASEWREPKEKVVRAHREVGTAGRQQPEISWQEAKRVNELTR
jgi:hypothetical protein